MTKHTIQVQAIEYNTVITDIDYNLFKPISLGVYQIIKIEPLKDREEFSIIEMANNSKYLIDYEYKRVLNLLR